MRELTKNDLKDKKIYWFNVKFSRWEHSFIIDKPDNIFFIFDENEILRGICTEDGTDPEEYGKKVEEQYRKMIETVQGYIKQYNEAMKKENEST